MAGIGDYSKKAKGSRGYKMKGFSGFTSNDEGKEPGPVKPKSIVDADPQGIHDDSEHNVAARRTEGTIEEQAAHVGGKYPNPKPLPKAKKKK